MKKKWKLICLALCAVIVSAAVSGCGSTAKTVADVQSAGVLVIATSPDFPPFEFLEGGDVKGIEIEILEQIAKELGVPLKIEQMDFESVIPGIQAGKFDVGVSGITATEKRKKNVDFSDPYFMASQAIVVRQGSSITCKADLNGKKISVQTGTTAEDFCMAADYEVLAFAANNDAAAALKSSKVDAWVVDNEVALAIAADQGLAVLDEAMTSEPYSFAFAKGSHELIAVFNEMIEKMLKDGTIEEIFQQYHVTFVSPLK